MRQIQIAVLAVGLIVAANARLTAGLYDPAQPTSPFVTAAGVRALYYDQFRDELDRLTSIADPLKPKGPRAAVVKQRDNLLNRGVANLNPTELAQLGALQWRLRDGDAALSTLKQATIRDPRNFWALTNLGSVHQSLGQLREALPNLEAARDVFPEPWPSGAPAVADWFKKAESYQFKLLRLRLRESMGRPAGGRPIPAADVDALFDVRFVGPSGQYEVGKLADSERSKLPQDAVAIVQQLLLWFPEDTRLLWLLGELYNADGNLEAASKVLDMCVWSRRYESPALREHRRLVQAAFEAQAGAAEPVPQAAEPAPPASILPGTWQLYTVGIIFGVLLLALAYWQVSELLRRLRGRTIE
jgi:tetratricopeptide (TPR) repeat protein